MLTHNNVRANLIIPHKAIWGIATCCHHLRRKGIRSTYHMLQLHTVRVFISYLFFSHECPGTNLLLSHDCTSLAFENKHRFKRSVRHHVQVCWGWLGNAWLGGERKRGGAQRHSRNKKHYSNRTWSAAVSCTAAVRTVTTATAEVRINYLLSPAKQAVDHESVIRKYLYWLV